ncbi:MAG: DNA polymerase III subunit delta [Actinomycetaceae bacterium]|nr:DNA polymerase III subunit delta [Actinomycetaceae bacterium]
MKIPWDSPRLEKVMLIRGGEDLLAERAMDKIRQLALEADPQTSVISVDPASYQGGELALHTQPSLFGGARLVRIRGLEQANAALIQDLLVYVDNPEDDVWLLLWHKSGVKGKKLLDKIAKKHPVIAADPLKRPAEKIGLLRADAKAAGRRVEAEALTALVDILGNDVAEMAAAFSQLVADTEGTITVQQVRKYYGTRIETTGFAVADAAVSGNHGKAQELLRHALANGASPVAIVAVLALKLRQLAKASGAGKTDLASWQEREARKVLRGWTENGLALAFAAVASADEEVKGAARDPEYAVERAVRRICAAYGRASQA